MTIAKKICNGLVISGVHVVAEMLGMEVNYEEKPKPAPAPTPKPDKRIALYKDIMAMGHKFVAQKRTVKKTIGWITFVTDKNGPAIWMRGHKITNPLELPYRCLFQLAAYCNKIAVDVEMYDKN